MARPTKLTPTDIISTNEKLQCRPDSPQERLLFASSSDSAVKTVNLKEQLVEKILASQLDNEDSDSGKM